MENEDYKEIADLFAVFNPALSDSQRFISRIEKNVETLEEVRSKYESDQRTTRRAVCIAASVGFVSGILASFLIPMLNSLIMESLSVIVSTIPVVTNKWMSMALSIALLLTTVTFLTANTYHFFSKSPSILSK